MGDISRVLRVSEMPLGVREACLERGHSEDAEMTVRDAMCEWTAWELGDKSWGYQAAEYVSSMTNKNSIL